MDAIRRADSFIDALAIGGPAPAQDAADAELAALLGNWRDEMRRPPATGLITEADAIAALNAGRAQKRLGPGRDRWTVDTEITPRKNRRGLSVVGAAAAAVLCVGGFGAVVAGAGPGDSLYGLRTTLFGTPKEVRDDQVGLAAKTTLNQVQDLIAQGDWSQAQNKLVEVSTQVASIGDEQQKQVLLDQFNDLSAKVVERDPAATAPPGVVYTVPPSAAELVPAVAPPGDPTTSTSSTTSAPTTSSTSETPATSVTSSVTTSPGSGTETAASTVPTSSASSAAPAAGSQQTTTPTSAAPATSPAESPGAATAPSATSAAPTTAVPSTSAAPEPSAVSAPPVTTTPAPVERSEAATPEAATPEAATPEAATPEASAPLPTEAATTAVEAPVTTTALVPVG
jgi:hypothetical protein